MIVLLIVLLGYIYYLPLTMFINLLLDPNHEFNKIISGTFIGILFLGIILSMLVPFVYDYYFSKNKKTDLSDESISKLSNKINPSQKVIDRLLKELENKDKDLSEKNKEFNALKDTYDKVIKNTAKNKDDSKINSYIINAEFEKAEEILLTRLISENKKIAQTYFNLGDISYLKSAYLLAIEYYKKGIEIDVDNEYYKVQIAESYGRLYRYDLKIEILNNLLSTYQDSQKIHYLQGYLGDTYNNIGDDKKSIYYLEEAFKNYRLNNSKDMKFELMLFRDLSRAYYLNGNYEKSLENIIIAINIQLNDFKDDIYSLADLYLQESDCYSMLGKFNESLKLTEKALTIRTQIYGMNSCEVAQTLVTLARIKSWQGYHQDAIKISLDALNIYNTLDTCTLLSLSICYHNIGYYYVQLYDANNAIYNLNKAVDINKNIFNEENIYIASDYVYLGIAYSINENYDLAIEYLYKALKIRKNLLNYNHSDIASTHCNLAAIYVRNGEYNEALSNLGKGYKIYLNNFGENYHSALTILLNTGLIYKYQGDEDNAIKYIKEAKEKLLKQFNEDHPNLIICYETLAELYFNRKNYIEAKNNLEKLEKLGKLENNNLLELVNAKIDLESKTKE